jgi:RNA polymerase sigma factor (sigma-70 family)
VMQCDIRIEMNEVVASDPNGSADAGLSNDPVEADSSADAQDAAAKEAHRYPDRAEVAALVRAAAMGDQGAWDSLVDRFASTVWAVARGYRLNAADAADVSQTTWLRLVEHLNRIEQPERVGAWLATTARREALRVLRMAGRQIPSGDDFEVLPDLQTSRSPDRDLIANERDRRVSELVEQLPPRSQRLLRLLSADSPLSYRDISEAMSMPIGSIGPTRARVLEQLRRLAVSAGFQLDDAFA